FLPDERHFLYGSGTVYVGDIAGGAPQRVLTADSGAIYVKGHLLFVRQETLYAQAFDLKTLAVSGEPFPIAQPVPTSGFSTSAAGNIVYRNGRDGVIGQFTWVDRKGKILSTVGEPLALSPGFNLSRDDHTIAMTRTIDGRTHIWLMD